MSETIKCPKCHSTSLVKDGINRSGSQRYQCKDCSKKFSQGDRRKGRPTEGDRPMTAAERKQRQRKRQKHQDSD